MTVMADLLSKPDLPQRKNGVHSQYPYSARTNRLACFFLIKAIENRGKDNPVQKDQVFVNKLIQKALEPVLIPLEIKDQAVSIKGDDNVSFVGDFKWTAEALINILKNGVEHTHEGGRIAISFPKMRYLRKLSLLITVKEFQKKIYRIYLNVFIKGKMRARGHRHRTCDGLQHHCESERSD